jgi:hypothetical protein
MPPCTDGFGRLHSSWVDRTNPVGSWADRILAPRNPWASMPAGAPGRALWATIWPEIIVSCLNEGRWGMGYINEINSMHNPSSGQGGIEKTSMEQKIPPRRRRNCAKYRLFGEQKSMKCPKMLALSRKAPAPRASRRRSFRPVPGTLVTPGFVEGNPR